jgi:hypothetical protein
MKTLMTAVLALSIFFTSYASDKSLMEVTSIETKDQRFSVTLKEAVGRVHISVYDGKGRMIDRNLFRANEPLVIPFNLSQLPEGKYRVKVETKDEEVNFEVSSRKPIEKKLLAYANVVDAHTISLKVVGIEKPGTSVSIYNQSHRKIASDNIHVLGGFKKNYVLKDMKASDVYMRVTDASGKMKYFYFD